MKNKFFPSRPDAKPTIYAYIDTNPQYKGLIKVGFTSKDAKTRVAQQYPIIKPGPLPYKIVLEESAMRNDGSAFTDHENNLKQVKLYVSDILPQAEEIYRTAIKSYEAGEITYIEFLQAKQTLINSRNNYINILFNYNRSIFTIEEIVGKSLIK